jgi:hypothetical protein
VLLLLGELGQGEGLPLGKVAGLQLGLGTQLEQCIVHRRHGEASER